VEACPRREHHFQPSSRIANAAALVYDRDLVPRPAKNGHSAGPFVVNSAFATELYLKALGLLHGRKMHGHDLEKLFREIPKAALEAVEQKLAELAPQDCWSSNIKNTADLRAVLHRHRNTFKNWRYLYERADAEEFNFPEAIFTMQVLHEACASHPKISPPA
jgi:HEPN domain-containing protein